ncbi:MAG: lipocalin-like domain-containing protein [Gammaproteobacteria bacterium]
MTRAIMVLLLALLTAACGPAADSGSGLTVVSLLGDGESAGYARASPAPDFTFPADHGPHPDYRSEWWYFTGNLVAGDGREFGFQLTFFRFALAADERTGASAWGTRQVWMGHFALTDVAGKRFHRAEVFQRGALGLAGARAAPFRAWIGDWEARQEGDEFFPLALSADGAGFGIDLQVSPLKPMVFQGDGGYSAKGPEPGNASLYYAFTRLAAEGVVRLGDKTVDVEGEAWLDREWSTSALGPGIEGWDWLSLQMDDGRDLMIYQLRHEDGSPSEFSAGSLIDAEGRVTRLASRDFSMRPGRRWRSPETGAAYPVEWTVEVPGEGLALEILPVMDGQEMDLSVLYWEGAVRSRVPGRDSLTGRGYLEMTGYGAP